ncbi:MULTISPECIES: hypothetical protein [unclassified Corallococcus]|uniref:hypothetical protein n=1 Tax=unclassified Corallococcus TaxID=2685029 RepID=UPI00131583E2|nr:MULTISPECIES: hypothetical protein [unclassified Corallococcus]
MQVTLAGTAHNASPETPEYARKKIRLPTRVNFGFAVKSAINDSVLIHGFRVRYAL